MIRTAMAVSKDTKFYIENLNYLQKETSPEQWDQKRMSVLTVMAVSS